jgi:hypothetical protein
MLRALADCNLCTVVSYRDHLGSVVASNLVTTVSNKCILVYERWLWGQICYELFADCNLRIGVTS